LPLLNTPNHGWQQAIAQLSRVLKPGGLAFINTPEGSEPLFVPYTEFINQTTLQHLANQHGLEVLSYTTQNMQTVLPSHEQRLGDQCLVRTLAYSILRKPKSM
jgi:ubiquinone/menaquinone biosynthesis C-methylase UbiE